MNWQLILFCCPISCSPVLAALTTQSQIFLYSAETNQFKGPWKQIECLTGGTEHHIISMVWAEASGNALWLLAGTRRGEVMIWNVKADEVLLHDTVKLADADITQLYWSQIGGLLALVTGDEMHIAQVTQSQENITLSLIANQPPSLGGSFVNLARWQESTLLYCTPGQVHLFDTFKGSYQSVFLEDNGEEESCSLRPAVCE